MGGKQPVSIPPYVVIAFEMTILFGGIATLIGMVVLGPPAALHALAHLRSALHATTASGWPSTARPSAADPCARSSPAAGAEEVRP